MKNNLLLFLLAIALLIVSDMFFANRMISYDVSEDVNEIQKSFENKEILAERFIDDILPDIEKNGEEVFLNIDFLNKAEQMYVDNKISVFIAKDENLLFWSNNSVPVSYDELPNQLYDLDNNENGFYYFKKTTHNDHEIWAYILIKNNYKYQNEFLKNSFAKSFNVNNDYLIYSNPAHGYPIYDINENYAFSIVPNETVYERKNTFIYALSIFLAVLSLVLLLYLGIQFNKKNRYFSIFGFSTVFIIPVFLVFVRALLFITQFPSVFYESKLFSPAVYASSSLLPSLGDLFLNAVFLTLICYLIFYNFKKELIIKPNKKLTKNLVGAFLFIGLFAFKILTVYLINTLVINSQLQLNVSFINEIDLYNIVGILIIGSLFLAYYFLSHTIISLNNQIFKNATSVLILYIVVFVLAIAAWHFYFDHISWHWILLCIIPCILLFHKNTENQIVHNLSSLTLSLFIFCIIATLALISFYKTKDIENRKSFAVRLSMEQDPIAEFMFNEIEERLYNDYSLTNLVANDPYDNDAIISYLKSKYFYDYWEKYDIQLTICSPSDVLIIKPSNVELDCFLFFEDYISDFGRPTLSNNLIFLDNNTGRSSYIAQIPIELASGREWEEREYILFLEFDSKFIPRDLGFPELLLDEGIEVSEYLNKYSYAVYKNGQLINKFGPFLYSTNSSVYGEHNEEFSVFDFDSFNHLHYNKDEETELIVSRPKDSILEIIAPFSYLFIIFFLMIIIYWFLRYDIKSLLALNINFKARLQVSMIGIVLISLISIVSVSAWFIYNIYQNKNRSYINEKAYSVLIEMEHHFVDMPVISTEDELYLNDLLLKLSNVFFTDINVYSPDGELIASSRSSIFEEGLISELMNPEAYLRLKGQKQILFVHREKIGDLDFLSAYLPLINQNNDVLAYINLPYFAKHGEFRSEISHLLVAFINVYLILLVLAILIAFVISNRVTRPLQLLKDSISSMRLGADNKKIDWVRHDEIGQIVKEYNRMMDELETSAALLAQSERESAWREMAKQVAHEIKNPLTPMKLSVQYLDKAWKDKTSDWDERLKRFCITMTEQIDNLSEIASAFSDFAKMPVGKFEKLDLKEFIYEMLDLYKDFENTVINVSVKEESPMIVNADKKQMIRVFNNLIKNALQSYNKSQKAVIDIVLYKENNNCCIEVRDYGQGISNDLKKNIFRPYFTTKTGGSGLGLAMVKSIIESFGGSVGFQSEENKGSTFFVKLAAV